MPSESAVAQVWIWSLVIYFVVVVVVAVLLTLILNTAKQIKAARRPSGRPVRRWPTTPSRFRCSRGPTTSSREILDSAVRTAGPWPLSSSTPVPVRTARRA